MQSLLLAGKSPLERECSLLMPTLLVIDDQQGVLDTLVNLLPTYGLAAVGAKSGAAGLALGETQSIDGALVDIHMPGLNGIHVCLELRERAQRQGRDLPVWLMTGSCTTEIRRLAAEAGAVTVFEKPFDLAELARELKSRLADPVVTVTDSPPAT